MIIIIEKKNENERRKILNSSRIECSLKGEILDVPTHPKAVDNSTSIEER
jgi:hypothetical protein